MKILKIKISRKNKRFLAKYHTGELRVENYDEVGTMAYGILSTSWDREKYKKDDEFEFELKYHLNDIIELRMDDKKFLSLRNLLTVEKINRIKVETPTQINDCQYRIFRYERSKKYTEIKFIACREASVNFNSYVDKLLNRVFLAYMQVEVLHNNKKIVDAIRDFQALYDLSDFDFSAETCKRFWQRHKNDAFAPFPLMM